MKRSSLPGQFVVVNLNEGRSRWEHVALLSLIRSVYAGDGMGVGDVLVAGRRVAAAQSERMSDTEFAELRAEMRSRYTGTAPQLRRDSKYDLCWMATINPRTAERGDKLKVDNLLLTIVARTIDGTVLRVGKRGAEARPHERKPLHHRQRFAAAGETLDAGITPDQKHPTAPPKPNC